MIPSRRPFHFGKFLLLPVFALLIGVLLYSQILPDAPIEGVKVTMFSDEGYKLWYLQGSQASYLEDGSVELTDMDLEVYQGQEGTEKDMHILGKQAVYQVDERMISGGGGVFVDGDFYEIEGDQWRYTQDDRIVRVSDNVKVTIDYELEAFLK